METIKIDCFFLSIYSINQFTPGPLLVRENGRLRTPHYRKSALLGSFYKNIAKTHYWESYTMYYGRNVYFLNPHYREIRTMGGRTNRGPGVHIFWIVLTWYKSIYMVSPNDIGIIVLRPYYYGGPIFCYCCTAIWVRPYGTYIQVCKKWDLTHTCIVLHTNNITTNVNLYWLSHASNSYIQRSLHSY